MSSGLSIDSIEIFALNTARIMDCDIFLTFVEVQQLHLPKTKDHEKDPIHPEYAIDFLVFINGTKKL
jgi:hypothetical protein